MVRRIKAIFQPAPGIEQAKEELRCKIDEAICLHEENIRSIAETKKDIERLTRDDAQIRKGA